MDGQLVKKVCSTFTLLCFKTTSSPADGLSMPVQIIKAEVVLGKGGGECVRRNCWCSAGEKWSRALENRDEGSPSERRSR